MAACMGALDLIKAPEDVRQISRRDAVAAVGDLKLHVLATPPQRHTDAALVGVLEGVGEQVEHHTLPHVAVDPDGLWQGRACHRQRQAGVFDRRAEHAGQLGGERGQIGGLIVGLGPAGLQARKVEQRVDELEQALRVAVRRGQPLVSCHRQPVGALGEFVFQRCQHQRERGAELVADVGEEGGLGAVDLGQGIGALTLGLGGQRAGDDAVDGAAQHVQEGRIGLVHRQPRAQAHHQQTDGLGRLRGAGPVDRQHPRRRHRLGVIGAHQAGETRAHIGHAGRRGTAAGLCQRPARAFVRQLHPLRAGGSTGQQPRVRDQPCASLLVVEPVEKRKRQVECGPGQHPRATAQGLVERVRLQAAGVELAQRARASLVEHLARGLGDGVEQTGHRALFVMDRAEGEGEEGLLQVTQPVEEHALVFEKGRLARQRAAKGLADDRERRGPAFGEVLPHRARMFAAADRPVTVVVELGVLRAPGQRDRKVGVQHQAHGGAQAGGPTLDRAQRRGRPILGAHAAAHLAAAGESVVAWRMLAHRAVGSA